MQAADNLTSPLWPGLVAQEDLCARRLAAAFARHGIREVYGQSIPSLFHLVAPEYGLRQIAYRTENAGGAMADGHSRTARRATLVTAQNGPAAALLVAPLAEALKASVPVIALVQEVDTAQQGRNAFQELDHGALFAGVCKAVVRLDVPGRTDDLVDRAVTLATSGRPGPVVIMVPGDVLAARDETPTMRRAKLGHLPLDRPMPDAEALEQAAVALATARQPLVIAGGGVHLSDAAGALAELQERFHLPVATTMMGKGAVDETHPLSPGPVGHVMAEGARAEGFYSYLRAADVILLIGTRTNQNGTNGWRLYPPQAHYIHLDLDPTEIGRNYEALRLVGDAKAGLLGLVAALSRQDLSQRAAARPSVEAVIAQSRELWRSRLAARIAAPAKGEWLRPEQVMAELDALLPANGIVVSDASYASVWTANYLTARRPGMRFLSPRGLAGLGWGLPMAIGARIAAPDEQVVCVTGDGGFAHCWAEIETAVRLGLSLPILVLNNGILGYQKDAEDALYGAHTEAVDFAPVDHAAIARACGAVGVRVSTPDQLGPAMRTALDHTGPTVIDILTDPAARPPISLYRGRFTDSGI